MKRLTRAFSLTVALALLARVPCAAQQEGVVPLSQLKEQVAKLVAVEQDAETPPEVKKLNRDFLADRLDSLRSLLRQRIAALRKYRAAVGSALTPKDLQVIEDSLGGMEGDLRAAEQLTLQYGGGAPSATAAAAAQVPRGAEIVPVNSADTPRPETLAVVASPARGSESSAGAPPAAAVATALSPCYAGAPDVIVSNVEKVAHDVVQKRNISPLSALYPDIFFYTVADAISTEEVNIRNLKAYRYMGETARTDKQTGASASSNGTTSAAEKPGFAELLSWAVEHGAIQQAVNGTSLTLSTSPYALLAASEGDSAENYERYKFFNHVGVSANFNVENQDSALASARRQQLNEWSVRLRLNGDRSTRGEDFRKYWETNIRSKIQRRLVVVTGAERFIDADPSLRALGDRVETQLDTDLRSIVSSASEADVKNAIMCGLENLVYNQVKPRQGGATVAVSQATVTRINTDFVPALFAAHADLEQARKDLSDYMDTLDKKPLTTFAYTNHRTAAGSDYSELKFLHERKAMSPLKLNFNAGVSFYNRPDRALGQQRVRDYAFALSFEGNTKGRSPFVTSEFDLSKITYSFTGRYERMPENRRMPDRKADIAVAQFKLEIPLLMGASIPFSVTYANASELIKEDHVRANFGFTFDVDKLFALKKIKE
ncbi:MAG: hypothetical protein LC746_11905 [Acidobacteria bacterium]|nr:hypothetical protein [Acidobacteriota bacterium]